MRLADDNNENNGNSEWYKSGSGSVVIRSCPAVADQLDAGVLDNLREELRLRESQLELAGTYGQQLVNDNEHLLEVKNELEDFLSNLQDQVHRLIKVYASAMHKLQLILHQWCCFYRICLSLLIKIKLN